MVGLRGNRIIAEVVLRKPTFFFSSSSSSFNSQPQQQQPQRRSMSSASLASSCSDDAEREFPLPPPPPPLEVFNAIDYGCMDYSKSWAWQHTLLSRRLMLRRRAKESGEEKTAEVNDPDCILLLEHSPVYTLGRGSDESHLTFLSSDSGDDDSDRILIREQQKQQLSRKSRGVGSARLAVDRQVDEVVGTLPLEQAVEHLSKLATPVVAPNGVPIYRVERGGEVTWHGPSQLVVYPLLDLNRPPYQRDLHWYLRMIEEVIILTLQQYDIEGYRDEENTGVWVNEEKVAAVGISSSRWITTHGFALNINPNLDYFDTSVILPCGIEGKGVTSIAKILLERGEKEETKIPELSEVANVVLDSIQKVFGISNVRHCDSPVFATVAKT
eukprot:scaffold8136_cov127-Cylindrotheca_fusiformis.AAC.18